MTSEVFFIQHFPQEKLVTISMSDFGLGIPSRVREKVENISDSEAIIRAVEEGFTTKSRPTNKGIGLDYLLKAVVLNNGGQVYSNEAIVKFDRDGTAIRPTVLPDVGFCPVRRLILAYVPIQSWSCLMNERIYNGDSDSRHRSRRKHIG